MLIITADDYGRDRSVTDVCLECFKRRKITTASILVFMEDTDRAATLAIQEGLETGLHLNVVLPYDRQMVSEEIRRSHEPAVRFFRAGAWTQLVYNPIISKSVVRSFQIQLEEYRRLFKRDPTHFNGHRHLHLSLNMIFANVIPEGSKVRRSFTFRVGEKSLFNRGYRRLIDAWLQKKYVITDSFYSLDPIGDERRLKKIIDAAQESNVELMTHPWRDAQLAYLTSQAFMSLLNNVRLGNFSQLHR